MASFRVMGVGESSAIKIERRCDVVTHSTGGVDASMDITKKITVNENIDVEPQTSTIGYRSVPSDYGAIVRLNYSSGTAKWSLTALDNIYNVVTGETYTNGQTIASWLYSAMYEGHFAKLIQ